MSALDNLIEEIGNFDKEMVSLAYLAAAELAQLRARNAELEEYHGFHMGIIPEGEPTVEEERLRAELAEAMKVMNNCLRQAMRLLQYHP